MWSVEALLLARQVSRSHTYVQDSVYQTAVSGIYHLNEKIQEAVRSVTADMIAATGRELRKRLVFMIEHNDDHVEAYRH